MARARLQDVLSATYLDDLEHRPIEEIRALRAECQQLEVDQSYLRRLVQGRLDIVRSEQARRVGGAGPSEVGDLVEHLPQILADRVHAPGVGLLDVAMPGIDGIEVCRRVNGSCKVVMLTAHDDATTEQASRVAGADAFLVKPFSSVELIDRVEAMARA